VREAAMRFHALVVARGLQNLAFTRV
jgi:hypothetical protein